jgi:hypothetical protein
VASAGEIAITLIVTIIVIGILYKLVEKLFGPKIDNLFDWMSKRW